MGGRGRTAHSRACDMQVVDKTHAQDIEWHQRVQMEEHPAAAVGLRSQRVWTGLDALKIRPAVCADLTTKTHNVHVTIRATVIRTFRIRNRSSAGLLPRHVHAQTKFDAAKVLPTGARDRTGEKGQGTGYDNQNSIVRL